MDAMNNLPPVEKHQAMMEILKKARQEHAQEEQSIRQEQREKRNPEPENLTHKSPHASLSVVNSQKNTWTIAVDNIPTPTQALDLKSLLRPEALPIASMFVENSSIPGMMKARLSFDTLLKATLAGQDLDGKEVSVFL